MFHSADFTFTIPPSQILSKLAESDKHRAHALQNKALAERAHSRRAMMCGVMAIGMPAGELRRTP